MDGWMDGWMDAVDMSDEIAALIPDPRRIYQWNPQYVPFRILRRAERWVSGRGDG